MPMAHGQAIEHSPPTRASDPQRRARAACCVFAFSRASCPLVPLNKLTWPSRRLVESRWRVKSRTTFVTDAMLRNPDPGDWLMLRRDYKATYYSPLNQITVQNVNDLHLVWSWAMQEGATNGNQPAPIVHNGVLYVNNAGMVLQALNAKTGDLIWENRYGSNPTAPAMRGIAIYDDKIFVATGKAHLMAFDARNGEVVWDTTIGDRSEGEYANTSGPIAVNGRLIQGWAAILAPCIAKRNASLALMTPRPAKKPGAFERWRSKANPEATAGGLCEHLPCRRRNVDHRKLRSGSEPDLLGTAKPNRGCG